MMLLRYRLPSAAILATLTFPHTARAQHSDSIVARATVAIASLKDTVALRSAGFSVIGVAYSKRILERPVPTELAGTPAEWHLHAICRGVPGEGMVLADGRDDCVARGGTPAGANIAMVHAWTIANPDGPYAHDNPALPFVATGLEPPAHAMADERLLGVALGESYGAKLVIAHRIDDMAQRAGKNQPLIEKRAALRALVPQLREAQRANDTRKFDALRKKTIDAWNALADEYRAAAPTPEMRARFDVELKEAVETMHHHM
ncbi:MAG: hypothetical protein JWM41_4414 [Gemmatimonadetes bacterium]|nr:hypothetical protein [Gemmatimonadota bacterium]